MNNILSVLYNCYTKLHFLVSVCFYGDISPGIGGGFTSSWKTSVNNVFFLHYNWLSVELCFTILEFYCSIPIYVISNLI